MGGNDLLLSVDGGVNDQTIGLCADAGADVFVTGSALFAHHDYRQAMEEFRSLALAHKKHSGLNMLRIVLIRPGATDYDCEERIQGALDIPLNRQGLMEVARAVDQLRTKALK